MGRTIPAYKIRMLEERLDWSRAPTSIAKLRGFAVKINPGLGAEIYPLV
jgi:hypothetical protein